MGLDYYINGTLRITKYEPAFYDDLELSYSIENPIESWDEKRKQWLRLHPAIGADSKQKVVLVAGSAPSVCENSVGGHLLLQLFKNKVDYCRIHGCEIFYNNALLHPKMIDFWAKYPIVKAAMLTHPEVEWVYWVDSDTVFTDMEFKLPLARYDNYNLVVHGWNQLIYEKQNWTSLNAGVFLIKNCQWSMELLDSRTSMGSQSPDYEKWGPTQKALFKDKLFPKSYLIYLLLKEKEK